jgi:hypothetical protein
VASAQIAMVKTINWRWLPAAHRARRIITRVYSVP